MKPNRHLSKEANLATHESPDSLMTNGFSSPEKPASVPASFEEIHHRAKTISPLLQEFLDRRPPPHWGLNE